jgi:hypothetical protein
MIAWNRTRTLVAGLAIIAATNAIALAGVAYNRAGEPASRVELTERELVLPGQWGMARESSAVFLDLRWRVACEREDVYAFGGRYCASSWLTTAKLAELGFDMAPAPDTPRGQRHYARTQAKAVYLALEMDGAAYQATLARAREHAAERAALAARNPGNKELADRARQAATHLREEEERNSRLFVIDAARDAERLRARYPDARKHVIVAGRVQPRVMSERGRHWIEGFVEALEVESLYVPRPLRESFVPLVEQAGHRGAGARAPYVVTVAYGARHEPWLVRAAVQPAAPR